MFSKFLQIFSPHNTHPKRHKDTRKTTGQSLVELAIAFPVIILLFSGLVEFGFILNYYLSLLDATREAARFASKADPFVIGSNPLVDNITYYEETAKTVKANLEPNPVHPENDTTRRVVLDSTTDDIIVSVFNVTTSGNGPPGRLYICASKSKDITRSPLSADYHWFNNHPTGLSSADICDQLIDGSMSSSIVLVEVYYAYHQILALPWLSPFMPDPLVLHAYSMMPLPPTSFANQAPAVFRLSFALWEK